MQELLNQNIKDIIGRFPEVEKVLSQYEIACVSCNVGTCRLRDIMEIHNLTEQEEQSVMKRIVREVYPDREIPIPRISRKPTSAGIHYSPPIKKLVNEHVLIKRLLALIPALIEEIRKDAGHAGPMVEASIDFIRSYADKFHHAKEEEVLFRYFDENAEIIKSMHKEHEIARAHVKSIQEALIKPDHQAVIEHLREYRDLLGEHIKKEDEILYPWMDRNLSTSQVGNLFTSFASIDAEFGDVPKEKEDFILELERIFEPKQGS